jgi:HEAT repeat protein
MVLPDGPAGSYPKSMTRGQENLRALLQRAAVAQDQDERYALAVQLQRRTDRPAFEAARALARSSKLDERVLGLDILGQLGYPAGRPFLEDSLPVVLACCGDDRPEVVSSAIMALGHLADRRGLPAILDHVTHPSEQVRFAVAVALPSVAGHPPAGAAEDALIRLTRDPDPEVRDWATMGLNSPFEADTEEIRNALADRLADEQGDIAGEALLGLAQRKDPRALAPLLARLDSDQPGNLIVEAAAALGAAEALPALNRLRNTGWADRDRRPSVLDHAIEACSRSTGPKS